MTTAHQILHDEIAALPSEKVTQVLSFVRYLQQVPSTEFYLDHEYIMAELEKSVQEADAPGSPRFTHEEVMAALRQQREARNHAV